MVLNLSITLLEALVNFESSYNFRTIRLLKCQLTRNALVKWRIKNSNFLFSKKQTVLPLEQNEQTK